MLQFNPELQALLDACSDKQQWSETLIAALGTTRRLRCKHDSSAQAEDAWVTGTEFLNVGLTGAMQIVSGNISYFGRGHSTTVRTAANLAVGVAALRIEGGGHWLQASLGLRGSGKDFQLPSNPTPTSGYGFAETTTVRAPNHLPSGTGPEVPVLGSDAPYKFVLEDWTSGAAVVVGESVFNNRADNFVFEDAEMAAEIGDIGVYQIDAPVVFGAFEFGAQLYVSAASNTESGTKPLYQVLVGAKPYATWLSYPAMDTYVQATATTFPEPFKVRLYAQNGTELYTFEMHDGLPINSPALSQKWTATQPLRPHFNCGMLLPWESENTARSGNAAKYFNGLTADSLRPSTAKQGDTALAKFPMISSYDSYNSLYHLYAMPRWGMRQDFDYGDSAPDVVANDPGPRDPYLFDKGTYHNYSGKIFRMQGWDWEPGNTCGHDWYTGPGGPRFDRAIIPSVLAIWGTDQNFVRLDGSVPIRSMINAWGKGYFNHSNHYLTNVTTFASIPDAEVLSGDWVYARAYYGGGPYQNGAEKTIDLITSGNGSDIDERHLDSTGRLPWCGWGVDSLHSYCQPGWWTLMLNSPMHAIATKFRFNAHWASSLGDSVPDQDPKAFFMVRIQAWRYLQYTMQWKLAAKHALGYSRAEIEDRFRLELETLHDEIYVPTFVTNSQDPYFVGIRKLGTPVAPSGQWVSLTTVGGTLGFYMGHCLALMKQVGLWDAMLAKSPKCALALRMIVDCFDKYCFDYILDTPGHIEAYQDTTPAHEGPWTAEEIDESWAAWATRNPAVGLADWIRNSAGVINDGGYERDVGQHLRAQYAFIRRDFFPEIAHPRLQAACAKFQEYYDAVEAKVAAASSSTDKRSADWHYRYPSLGFLKAPV